MDDTMSANLRYERAVYQGNLIPLIQSVSLKKEGFSDKGMWTSKMVLQGSNVRNGPVPESRPTTRMTRSGCDAGLPRDVFSTSRHLRIDPCLSLIHI